MIFCKTGELIIRSLEHADKKFLVKWLSDSKFLNIMKEETIYMMKIWWKRNSILVVRKQDV